MSTSLSRQLDQLRATRTYQSRSGGGDISLASLGPNLLEDYPQTLQLSGEQLTVLAKESLHQLSSTCPPLVRFRSLLFQGDPDSLEQEEDAEDDEEGITLEDFLYLLSPYTLTKAAQYLLQYMVSKKKAHLSHPLALFCSTLPYYEYAIFNRIVGCLPASDSNKDYPRWIERFKHACHPATSVGLYKHVASDSGFFQLLCHTLANTLMKQQAKRHQNNAPDASYDKLAHCLTTSLVGGLNLCSGVLSQHQTYNLVRVILAGLKSKNCEFRASGTIMFAYLVPKVSLTPKAVAKLVKTVGTMDKNVDTLAMVALLCRCQKEHIDRETVLNQVVLGHAEVIEREFASVAKQDDEDVEFARRVVKMMALLLQESPKNFELIRLIHFCVSQGLKVDAETADLLLKVTSKILRKKKSKKIRDDENQQKRMASTTQKLVNLLRCDFVEEFARHHGPSQHQLEVFDCTDENQLKIMRLLHDNAFVRKLKTDYHRDLDKDDVKANSKAVKTLLQTLLLVDKKMIVISGQEMAKLGINILTAYEHKSSVLKLALRFITSSDFRDNLVVQQELKDNNVDLDTVLFKQLFALNDKTKDELVNFAKALKLDPNLEKEGGGLLDQKLLLNSKLDYEHLINHLASISDSQMVMDKLSRNHEPDALTILLLVLSTQTKNAGKKILQVLVAIISNNLPLLSSSEEEKEVDDFKQILKARRSKKIPIEVVLKAVDKTQDLLEHDQDSWNSLLQVCVGLKANNFEEASAKVWQVLQEASPETCFLNALKVSCCESESKERKLVCLNGILKNHLLLKKEGLAFDKPYIPLILAGLNSCSKKVRKLLANICQVLVEKKKRSHNNHVALVKFLVENKPLLVATNANIPQVMDEFKVDDTSGPQLSAIVGSTVASGQDLHPFFAQLVPFLCSTKEEDLAKLADYGNDLLKAKQSKAIEALLTSQMSAFVQHSIDSSPTWQFLKNCFKETTLTLNHNGLVKSVSVVALELLSQQHKHFEEGAAKKMVFSAIVDLSGLTTPCVPSHVLLAARNVVQQMGIISETQLFYHEKLSEIWTEKDEEEVVVKWQKTTFLLELFLVVLSENNQNVSSSSSNPQQLLKLYSGLLKRALLKDDAYLLDLLLSTMLLEVEGLKVGLDPELIVQCIRTCKNPDTQATSLLLLAKSSAACTNAEYLLHNSIPLFTFVGTHFLQKAEARANFDIACTAIDIMVPHILKACKDKRESKETSVCILNTFVDASSDMAQHRFNVFMRRLVACVGESQYLWLLTLLLLKKVKASNTKNRGSTMLEERQQQLRDLYSHIQPSSIQMEAVLQMTTNLMVMENEGEVKKLLGLESNKEEEALKQLQLVRIKMMSFVHSLLTSAVFKRQIHEDGDDDDQFRKLVQVAIVNVERAKKKSESRQLVACCEKVLESTLAIVPATSFVPLLASLLASNNEATVQKKTLEVLNLRLLQDDPGSLKMDCGLLLEPLTCLATSTSGGQQQQTQQLALLCLRSFAKVFSTSQVEHLKVVCGQLAKKKFLKDISHNSSVVAAALLCLTELFTAVGPHAVVYLTPYINWILDLMASFHQDDQDENNNPIVLNSIVVAVQRAMDNFGGFLNPHFGKLVMAACKLPISTSRPSRVKHLHAALSRGIPTHSLISVARLCYDEVASSPTHVATLAHILKANVAQLDKTQALALSKPFLDFFLHAFTYRRLHHGGLDQVDRVEEELAEAFLTLALKLSLDDFKPMFYRMFNMAYEQSEDLASLTTVFRITGMVGAKLKSLFGFVCEMLVNKATGVLNDYSARDYEKVRLESDKNGVAGLLKSILEALTTIFMYNRVEALLSKSYEDHVNALLEHLSCPLDQELLIGDVHEKLKLCLGQLAAATEDETQWKYLNYQVLLQIRNRSVGVRLNVLDTVDMFLEKRGENYLSVLPDSVHLLAEALEDDDHRVEARCRKLVKSMEETFGHSVESYFE